MHGLWIWWLTMTYRIKPETNLAECLSSLFSHLEVWGLLFISATLSEVTVDGEIPEDQLDHLGLEK